MEGSTLGIQVAAANAPALLSDIETAERLGIPAIWTTSEGVDGLTLYAAAAVRTSNVILGTAIVRAATRHPIGLAQQAATVAQLAPGRLRLGIGPIHPGQAGTYGSVPAKPLAHLRAYITAVRSLLDTGSVDIDEAGVVAHARLDGGPFQVPILAPALRRGSFKFCGEVADGAITWICPLRYVMDVARPAMLSGAEAAGRRPPRLVVHVPVALSGDVTAARAAMRERYAFYLRAPNYVAMFGDAGFPEAAENRWSDAMIDSVAIYGSQSEVADRLQALMKTDGIDLLVSVVGAGDDPQGEAERTLQFLAELATRN